MSIENISITSPEGTLEGRLILPKSGGPFPGVVMCHPHSMMGGNMDNNVILGVCSVLEQREYACLIFNFRGVGKSTGVFDNGKGEIEDTLYAISFLANHTDINSEAILLAGYSFGAGVALNAATNNNINIALALIGRARVDPETELNNRPDMPILFVVGDRDKIMTKEEWEGLQLISAVKPELQILPDADHFLIGKELEVGMIVADFFDNVLKNQKNI
jgi:alpha/beta superfamily hydrolase